MMIRDPLRLTVILASLGLVACGSPAEEGGDPVREAESVQAAGRLDRLQAHAPANFGFGAEASEARIASWDIDVRPDGEGLPPGSGSVTRGREVYQIHCVACHGPTGTEGPNDRLVDTEQWVDSPATRTVGNFWPYATTLYDYIRKAMPQATPGILTADEVYAVIAYILYLNEIVPEDAVLDAEVLPSVVMPARDKFVIDDRNGGAGPIR